MLDSIELFIFIQKYHQELDASLRGLRGSKQFHVGESDRRDWIVSYRLAMIVLRDIGRFMLGIEQPHLDLDFDDDPFFDIGRQEVQRKVTKQQVGDDRDDDSDLADIMRLAAATAWIESTSQFERSPHNGKLQRLFRVRDECEWLG